MFGWLLRRLVRLPLLLLRSPFLLLAALGDRLGGRQVLRIRLQGAVPEVPEDSLRRFLPGYSRPTSLAEALDALEEAAADPKLQAVVLELDEAELGLVQAECLVRRLDAVRAAGKRSLVWVDGTTGPALLLGAASDRLEAFPEGTLDFLGFRVRAVFVRDLLGILGAVPDIDHIGDYKTFSDTFTHDHMTEAHREMATDLGGDLFDQVLSSLSAGRQRSREDLEAALGDAPLDHRRAASLGLLDAVSYRDEVEEAAGRLLGLDPDDEPSVCGVSTLLDRRRRRLRIRDAFRDRPRVAIVPLVGSIQSGDDGRGVRGRAVVKVLDELREDPGVKAVVLRIDSPGGSAMASESIWRAVRRLDKEKPVVASLGRVAASGGYYIAVGCREILAHSGSLTGSIGVVSGKFHLGPALHRWGVRVEGVSFGARAGMYDPDRGFTDDERVGHRRELERVYRVFVERVAAGRGMEFDAVDALARGRVYTGRRALELSLVDRLGDLDQALEVACQHAGIRGPVRTVRCETSKKGLGSLAFGGRAVLEPLVTLSDGLALLREGTLTWCPWEVR